MKRTHVLTLLPLFLGFLTSSLAQEIYLNAPVFPSGDTSIFYFNTDWELLDNPKVASYHRKAWPVDKDRYEVRDYFANGQVQMVATLENPNPLFTRTTAYGDRIYFYESGDTSTFEHYNDSGKRDGNWYEWHENGQLSWKKFYKGGEQQGEQRSFHPNGELKLVKKYRDGKIHGPYIEYDSTGIIQEEGFYKKGKRQGEWWYYHENGKLEEIVTYTADWKRIDDNYVSYHPNGAVADTGAYLDGEKQGLWTYYHPNGKVHEQITYESGEKTGEVLSYDSTGALTAERTFVEGKPDGEWKTYHANGKLDVLEVYKNDWTEISGEQYREDGSLTLSWSYKEGEKQEVYYDLSGSKLKPKEVATMPEPQEDLLALLQKLTYDTDYRTWADQVIVSFRVNASGEIDDLHILETGNWYVDSLVLEGLKSVTFAPGTHFSEESDYQNALKIGFDRRGFTSVELGTYYLSQELIDETFSIVEEMPKYPGGERELFSYLAKNTRYPKVARDAGISGVIYITFIVDASGLVCQSSIIRGIHPSLDVEGLRVVRSMPPWKAGKQRGKPVKVQYNLPLRFILK